MSNWKNLTPRHILCEYAYCSICLDDSDMLAALLDTLTYTNTTEDHLGLYHRWLNDNGITPETPYGWWTAAVFEKENILSYARWYNLGRSKIKCFRCKGEGVI